MQHELNNAVGPQRGKKAKKNKWMIVFVLLSFFIGLQIATQYFAAKFQYQSQLGVNLHGFYWPWAILNWGNTWYADYPLVFKASFGIGIMVVSVLLMVCVKVATGFTNTGSSNPYLHGSARWAEKKDIETAGLLGNKEGKEGVYVGAWQDAAGEIHYLRHNGPEHILT
jgi:type IV secretion system protein VirD4